LHDQYEGKAKRGGALGASAGSPLGIAPGALDIRLRAINIVLRAINIARRAIKIRRRSALSAG
jgi:hypothetical protein